MREGGVIAGFYGTSNKMSEIIARCICVVVQESEISTGHRQGLCSIGGEGSGFWTS